MQSSIESIICVLFNHPFNHKLFALFIEAGFVFVLFQAVEGLRSVNIVTKLSDHRGTRVQKCEIARAVLELLFSYFEK